jgi:hypothetical protein
VTLTSRGTFRWGVAVGGHTVQQSCPSRREQPRAFGHAHFFCRCRYYKTVLIVITDKAVKSGKTKCKNNEFCYFMVTTMVEQKLTVLPKLIYNIGPRPTGEWAAAVNATQCAYASATTETLHKFASMNTSFDNYTLLESAKHFLNFTGNPEVFQVPIWGSNAGRSMYNN